MERNEKIPSADAVFGHGIGSLSNHLDGDDPIENAELNPTRPYPHLSLTLRTVTATLYSHGS